MKRIFGVRAGQQWVIGCVLSVASVKVAAQSEPMIPFGGETLLERVTDGKKKIRLGGYEYSVLFRG